MHYSRKGIYKTNYLRYDRWVPTAYRLGTHGDLKLRQPVQPRKNTHKAMPRSGLISSLQSLWHTPSLGTRDKGNVPMHKRHIMKRNGGNGGQKINEGI
jgi:hypothetical protein